MLSLKKKYLTSNAVRNKLKGVFLLNKFLYFKKLRYTHHSAAGRSKYQGVVVFSKGRCRRRFIFPKINTCVRRFFNLSFVYNHLYNFKLNKVYNLYISYSGFFWYGASVANLLFSSFLIYNSHFNITYLSQYINLNRLIFLHRNATVSQLPGRSGKVIYIKSAGTYGRVLNKNASLHLTLIKLPSGAYKLFNSFAVVFLNKNNFSDLRKLTAQKAGLFSIFGVKPKVRGVAKNPVDHPHGGRTKSIKCPKTP